MNIASIGIDLGKTSFHLVAVDDHGKVVVKKKFSRKQLSTYRARNRSVLCSPLHWCGTSCPGPRCTLHSSGVRKAFCKIQQESWVADIVWVTEKETPVTHLRKMNREDLQRRNYPALRARSNFLRRFSPFQPSPVEA
jgi:hypothetical protein